MEFFSDIPASVLSNSTLTAEKSSCNGNGTESCQDSQSGMTLKHLMQIHGEEELKSCVEDSPARTSAPPVMAQELSELGADFGGRCSEWFAKLDPKSYSWKTPHCSLFEDSEPFSVIWHRWGIMLNGACFPQRALALLICGKESLSWPTPTASEEKDIAKAETLYKLSIREEFGASGRLARTICKLSPTLHSSQQVVGLNPSFAEKMMLWPIGSTDLKPLGMDKFQQWLSLHGKP